MSKHTSSEQATPRQFFKAFFVLLWACAFYPIMIGLFLWLWYKGHHWAYGAFIVLAMLIFDPFWGLLGRSIVRKFRSK